MFTPLDKILYPDNVYEVFEYAKDCFVYNIYKNGSSTIRGSGFRQLNQHEVKNLSTVDVFIRDPLDRYASGVQTFLEKLPASYNRNTAISLLDEYVFLNRHHQLQLHWIINLCQVVNKDTTFNIRHLDELQTVSKHYYNTSNRDREIVKHCLSNDNAQYYLLADRVLYTTLMNKSVTIKQILESVQSEYPDLYNDMFGLTKRLTNVLS